MNRKPTKAYRVFQGINTVVMIFVIFITLYPFVYLIAQSFSSDSAVSAGLVSFYPIDFNIDTYKYILRDNQFFKYYWNTILYSAVGTALSVISTALIAYPLSKPRLKLNKFITPMVVFTMYFAGGMIPNYIVVTQWLGLQDSMWSIILPGAISTFNLLVMKSFFAGLPLLPFHTGRRRRTGESIQQGRTSGKRNHDHHQCTGGTGREGVYQDVAVH